MRRTLSLGAAVALLAGLAWASPAAATHCDPADPADCPNPVNVIIFEGLGHVCDQANIPGASCTYGSDPLWDVTEGLSPWGDGNHLQGLYWPGYGPPAEGPFTFEAGPTTTPGADLCIASAGGVGCTIDSDGMLEAGEAGLGAYCGSSRGHSATTRFTSADGTLYTEAEYGWEQSAATILPLYGQVTLTDPPGGEGATLIGFTSSRGTGEGGNCGITAPTTAFQTEGMSVVF